MLFTRCPNCQTSFRVTADTLRVAHGAVRCGNCATVYSAFSGLRQDTLDPGMQADEDLLSPTLQTQELAAIEEIASPDVEAQDTAGDASEVAETTAPSVDAPPSATDAATGTGISAEPPRDDEPIEITVDDSSSAPNTIERVAEGKSHDRTDSEDDEEPQEPVTGATSGSLRFEILADDDWSQVLKEIEESTRDDQIAAPTSADRDDDASVADSTDAEPEDERDFFDIAESPELERRGEARSDEEPREPSLSVAKSRESTMAPAGAASFADALDAEPEIELATAEKPITAEQIDATLSADSDSDLMAALEMGLASPPATRRRGRLWQLGAAAMAVVLTAQLVHHNRARLAAQPIAGPLVQGTYALFGVTLAPSWNLDQYDISNWAATAGETEDGIGNLRITAQISNGGPTPQPYPSIRLELKDRWETVVGRRVFTPHEYLGTDFDADALMSSGESVPADLAVVDPGFDASGFELDVCLASGNETFRCASDRVFD